MARLDRLAAGRGRDLFLKGPRCRRNVVIVIILGTAGGPVSAKERRRHAGHTGQ